MLSSVGKTLISKSKKPNSAILLGFFMPKNVRVYTLIFVSFITVAVMVVPG